MNKARILIVEDEPLLGDPLKQALAGAGYQVRLALNGAEALEFATDESFDFLLEDVRLPDADGLDILNEILSRQPQCKALVMTGYGTIEAAVEAMKRGAVDFLTKPFPMEVLIMKLQRVLEYREMEKEIDLLRGRDARTGVIVSRSPAMRVVQATAAAVAVTNTTVLLQGESGTGKELLADAIHAQSQRRHKPHIKLNCAAIPETLLESELFGVERGAFTGADKSRPGYLEAAAGGTLFLDEIGDLPLPLQAKMLRVLEEKSTCRVGGIRTHNVDFRLIAASNSDLRGMVREKKFREDLFFRLNVVPITIPPLRERMEDIPLLIAHFLNQLTENHGGGKLDFSPEALEALRLYSYPGNVRELKNLVEQFFLLYPGETIKPRHLPEYLRLPPLAGSVFESFPVDRPLKETVAIFESRYIEKVLKSVGGNRTRAAAALGLSRKVLWERLKRK